MRVRALSLALIGGVSLPSLVAAGSLGLVAVGCSGGPTIPGTEIPDTDDNRQILAVLERYRTSFISRDAAAVLSTAHPTYHDNAGTDDPSDDTTYAELGPLLRRRLAQLDSIRFTIDYLEILGEGDRAVVRVWIDASFRFKPILDTYGMPRESPPFARVMDHSEFELVREGDTWLIVRGI
ncbi:MAG: hypothetical protein R6X02_25690 [Enhygromyxa sp.]